VTEQATGIYNNDSGYMAEGALLSALIHDPAAIMEVELCHTDFVSSQHGAIFKAIRTLSGMSEVVDVVTVIEHLNRETGRNWLPVVTEVVMGAGSPANAKNYAGIIRGCSSNRKAAKIGNFLMENSQREEAVGEAIKMLMEIGRNRAPTEYDLKQLVTMTVNELDRLIKNPGVLTGVSTGLVDLDDLLGGYHDGDLIIIGARPAVGKTAVMLNQMLGAQQMVGCISGEQGIIQIGQRLMAMAGRVSAMSMRNGRLQEGDWPKLQAGAGILKSHPGMVFSDQSSPTIDHIKACARRWKYERNIKALYLDYLQKIKRDPKKPKHEAVGDNAGELKDLARELQIPVIALAQLSRQAEGRRATMADLSDSSEIEKEADIIKLLYREQDTGMIEFNVDKNRHGATGVVISAWDGRYLKVGDLSKYGEHH